MSGDKHRLRLMGTFGAEAPLSRKARALLAYLALNPDTAVTRERMAGLLWSERSEEQARGSLRQCLQELRPFAAGPFPLITIGRLEVTLWGGRAVTDLDEIRALAATGDALALAGRLGGSRLLSNLDGLDPAFDDWLAVRRADIDNQILAEAAACARAILAERPAEALRLAQAIIAREPLDEAAARLAITAARAAGQEGEAHRIWRRLEETLRADLGVAPSAESAACHADLAAATRPAAIASPPAAAASPPSRREDTRPSIAVLPFADLTAARDQGHLCDGMAVEIITALTRFSSLFVIAASSSLKYRDIAASRREIAAEFGVRYLLEGAVRRAADTVRITVQLTEAGAGPPIWAERFDGSLVDVFALQDEVAWAVAGQIAPSILAAETRRASSRPTADLGAYELYLRAYQSAEANSKETVLAAVALLDQAIARDPGYAVALAFAGFCHAILAAYGWTDRPRETFARAVELARDALRRDSDNAEVLNYVAAVTAISGGDLPVADAMVERSLARNPGAALAWQTSGWIKSMGGRAELGLAHFQTAARIDPHSGWLTAQALIGTGCCLLCLGRYDEAVTPLSEAAERLPGQTGARIWLAAALAHCGRAAEAAAAVRGVHAGAIAASLGLFRDPGAREVIRSGLAMAGAEV